MNKRQKEVQQSMLQEEQEYIRRLKETYRQASRDCENKIRELSTRTDLENIQSIVYQKQYQQILKMQIDEALMDLQSNEYRGMNEYLENCYMNGAVGAFYDMHGQGVPVLFPIDQSQVAKAVKLDSKISVGLYTRLGEDVLNLKENIRNEVSRGIANGSTWNQTASNLAMGMRSPLNKSYNNAVRIARTEGHRIQNQAQMDTLNKAKSKGADVVKQWDSTLDDDTRDTHKQLDGQIREIDQPFEVNGKTAMQPGGFGDPAEDCNCRCCMLQRAKWALDESELKELESRAEYFGLDKAESFEDFKNKYLHATNGKSAGQINYGDSSLPILFGTLDFNDESAIMESLRNFELEVAGLSYERCRTITSDGKIWDTDGSAGFVDTSLIESQNNGSSLKGSYSYHNHPKEQTHFSFSGEDAACFISNGESFAKASDYKYSYIMRRTKNTVIADYETVRNDFYNIYKNDVYQLSFDDIIDIDEDGFHETMKLMAEKYKFSYTRIDYSD